MIVRQRQEQNSINFFAILSGSQDSTTIMIKNIPLRFSKSEML